MPINEDSRFSRDGHLLYDEGQNTVAEAHVWDMATGKILLAAANESRFVVASDDQRGLVYSGAMPMRVVDVSSGATLFTFPVPNGGVRNACFSPDDKFIAETGMDGTARLWSRRRPEYWWGIAWLPESWVALVSGVVLVAMGVRRLRRKSS